MTEPPFAFWPVLLADLRRRDALVAGGRGPTRPSWRLALTAFGPRSAPVTLCRLAHWLHLRRLGPLARAVSLVNFVVFGIEIAVRCPIGPGLFFPHTQGTVIGAARIGANATIYQGVTLGAKELDFGYAESSRPVLGDGVLVGSGAKVLGGVRVGDGARVAANAVVLESVPDGALAAGVPARVIAPSPAAAADRVAPVARA